MLLKMRIHTFAMALVGLNPTCAFQQLTEPYRPPGALYSPEYSAIQEPVKTPTQAPERNFFCPGDTKAVVGGQVTPTSLTGSDLYATCFYGAHWVRFRQGRVYNYANFSGRLKVRIFPTAPIEAAPREPSPLKACDATNRETDVGEGHYTDGTEGEDFLGLAPQSVSIPNTSDCIPQEIDPIPVAIAQAPPTVYAPSVRSLPTI